MELIRNTLLVLTIVLSEIYLPFKKTSPKKVKGIFNDESSA